MVRVLPACHGFAMMVAKRPRHGGKAAMIRAKFGRYGFAITISIGVLPSPQRLFKNNHIIQQQNGSGVHRRDSASCRYNFM
jgi:hypothetical protein